MDNRFYISVDSNNIEMEAVIIFMELAVPTSVTFVEDSRITIIYFLVALRQVGGKHGLLWVLVSWVNKLMFFLEVPNF